MEAVVAARAESVRRPGRPGAGTPVVPEGESILLRGLEAFAELGYEGASARELARRLGVSHNFINDRYGSKAAFWRAVVDQALGAQLARIPQVDESLEDAELLRQTITGFYRTAADAPLIGRLFVNEFTLDTERLDYLYEHYIAPTLQTLVPSIDRLVASGRMAPIPMDVLFFAIIPPISGMVEVPLARRLGRSEASSPEQLTATAESLATLVVNGLLGTGSDSRR
ncbi:TetR family transcriptional regulator [Streptomyces sp. 110]|uniref:TetR family transcriptional regulator n=1 Tax=Streptomyces endocoffeicus TaxID=2898945 RepID=A0ABS1Q706_9ACTN|nr:TetR/AcrR family transcriptional regulator [Streptomyces endocoffeicus]MBL1120456.1 TetR family transcriptional regulator [Streptomyces endocoffeicus]